MFRHILEKLSAFKADARGIVFYLVALLLVPFVLLLGVAVDVGQLLVIKNQLSAAIDAAALNIAANPSLTSTQAQAQAQAFVNANFSTQNPSATLTSLVATQNTAATPPTVSITATATMNTAFLQIVGYSTLSTTVSTLVTLAQNYLEVVLVLDNTGSMAQMYGSMTGIQGLITAATTLVNTLHANDPTGKYVKIGVVPFTAAVNVGTTYANASWMDSAGVGAMTRENLSIPAGQGLLSLYGTGELKNVSWLGCVRQRTEPYDVEDVAPTASNAATLFTPYFAPSEPQQGGFYNNYLSDGTCWQGNTQQEEEADQQCIAKYKNGSVQGLPDLGPNFSCPLQQIIRLTNDQTAVLNEINAMKAYGATVIPAGLMWGWHLLSPNGPFGDGVPYSNTTTVKVIILLTDGFNDVQLTSNYVPPTEPTNGFNQSIYSAYGYAGSTPSHLKSVSLPADMNGVQDQPDYNLDQKEIQLCNNIKAVTGANGSPGRILIYAIGFGTVINNSSLQLLQQCATNSSTYFYNPTSEELITTFQNIAIGLNALRISR
ncbi:MAG: pilus assembly protein TadG-related protein [Rhodomicrobium sp.]